LRLQLTPVAEDDLGRIYIFNLRRSWRWAEHVEERLGQRMGDLPATPSVGRPVTYHDVKRLSVPDIQYVINYELAENVVRILRVRHTREIR